MRLSNFCQGAVFGEPTDHWHLKLSTFMHPTPVASGKHPGWLVLMPLQCAMCEELAAEEEGELTTQKEFVRSGATVSDDMIPSTCHLRHWLGLTGTSPHMG